MDRVALCIDNADHARALLRPLLEGGQPPSLVVLVACPPRLTRRIGKWVSHSNREHWRASWSRRLFEELDPLLAASAGTQVEREIAHAPLTAMAQHLRKTWGSELKVFDARKPRLGQELDQLEPGVPTLSPRPTLSPIAVTSSICAVLALAD